MATAAQQAVRSNARRPVAPTAIEALPTTVSVVVHGLMAARGSRPQTPSRRRRRDGETGAPTAGGVRPLLRFKEARRSSLMPTCDHPAAAAGAAAKGRRASTDGVFLSPAAQQQHARRSSTRRGASRACWLCVAPLSRAREPRVRSPSPGGGAPRGVRPPKPAAAVHATRSQARARSLLRRPSARRCRGLRAPTSSRCRTWRRWT